MHECPQCSTLMEEDVERCPKCGFNFNYLLEYPYKVGKCIHNDKECYIEGLNYELCDIYLHKAGIK